MHKCPLVFSLLLLGLAAIFGGSAQAANVTVNPAKTYQTILGWDAVSLVGCPLNPRLREAILDYEVNDLGLTGLRLEPQRREWEDAVNDDGDPYHVNEAAFKHAAFDLDMENWVVPMKQLVTANGDPFNCYFSPSFYDGGSTGTAPAWLFNSPAEYAEWAGAYLLYLKKRFNIAVDFYNICNEPENSNQYNVAVIGNDIKELGPRLRKLGLPTKIQLAEGINSAVTWKYVQAMRNDPDIWKYVGCLSWHLYGDQSKRPDIRDVAVKDGLVTAQTEDMKTIITDFYNDLTDGGVSYWTHYGTGGYDAGNQNDNCQAYLFWDKSGTSFIRYFQYWNFRQIMHYVRPGAVRVDAACDDGCLQPLAFVNKGKLTVVLINKTDQQARTATLTGLPAGQYGLMQTVNNVSPVETGIKTVGADGTLTVDVPARVVLTLYPYAGKNLPPTITDWQVYPGFIHLPTSSVNLIGKATDPELDPLTYQWTVTEQPNGATVVLMSPNNAGTAANGLTVAGVYTFTLAVSDGKNTVSKKSFVTVFDGNQAPCIYPWMPQSRIPCTVVLPNDSCIIQMMGYDPENDPLTISREIVRQPDGAHAQFATPAAPNCKVTGMTVPGQYVFRSTVSDGQHATSADLTVTVWPPDAGPTINQVVADPVANGGTTLTATASAEKGEILTYWWSVKRSPAGAAPVLATPGLPMTKVTGLTQPGQYTFTVMVATRVKFVTRDLTVTVP